MSSTLKSAPSVINDVDPLGFKGYSGRNMTYVNSRNGLDKTTSGISGFAVHLHLNTAKVMKSFQINLLTLCLMDPFIFYMENMFKLISFPLIKILSNWHLI